MLMCIAHDRECGCATSRPGRVSPSAPAYGIVTDPTEAGYVVKHKDGRCNSYPTQTRLPLPEPAGRERTIGELLALLAGAGMKRPHNPQSP